MKIIYDVINEEKRQQDLKFATSFSQESSDASEISDHVTTKLADLPPNAVLDEQGMAVCLEVTSTRTIRRMVQRLELPAGVKVGNRKLWLAGQVIDFLNDRMTKSIEETNKQYNKLRRF